MIRFFLPFIFFPGKLSWLPIYIHNVNNLPRCPDMKWTVLMIALMMLVCTNSFAQLTTYDQGSQYMGDQSFSSVSYSVSTTGGAPVPTAPQSVGSLGLQIPSDVLSTSQGPSAQEQTQTLISTSQDAAYAFAPGGSDATAVNSVYRMVIAPQGGYAPNNLYISYAPRTVASCNLYANLPLWMDSSGMGSIWFYEWYPSGMLDTQYAGYVYSPGWYKRWFFADTPGWHILQYYCGGWSNYAYIYVYGQSAYWVNPNPVYDPSPYPYPYWDSEITYTYPPTGHTYYSYESSLATL
ncbi:MAG: hypothetical protein QG666_970 [Euryarchaeota archaeon]|nr:hypothetical protein [Euryarchaeota archaeon]